jgi:succinoglycan biosynthesis transport protein ExoP
LPESERTDAAVVEPPSILGLLRRRALVILLPAVLVGGAALGFSLLEEKQYEASTSVLFRDSGGTAALSSADPAREAATNVRLLQLGVLDERVDERLDEPFTGGVDVIAEEEANLATITATDTNPRRAARVANIYAEEYVDLRRDFIRKEVRREQRAVAAELERQSPSEEEGPEASALRDRLDQLAVAVGASGARHVNPAVPRSNAVSPRPLRNAAIGTLIGLAIGIALAIALEARDRRVREPRQLEHIFGRPIIGRIPRSRALAKLGFRSSALPGAEAEAFRTTRANLRHLLRERDGRTVLVTSAGPREGKTTITWNLARVEAASGARVLLVEADMRRPDLSVGLGANGAAGLSELLAGDAKLESLVESIRVEDRADGDKAAATIDVLFAGRPTANPAELLDSSRMQAMLEVVPDSYDLVVIDTPPTAVVSDVMPILALVGGVVVVGRIGLTTHESLQGLRDQLENWDAPILGVVVNADAPSASSSYYSSTRY